MEENWVSTDRVEEGFPVPVGIEYYILASARIEFFKFGFWVGVFEEEYCYGEFGVIADFVPFTVSWRVHHFLPNLSLVFTSLQINQFLVFFVHFSG